MTVAVDLLAVLAEAIEQAPADARARLRAALEVDVSRSEVRTLSQAVFTPAVLAAQLGRTPRAIRAAIARGELQAVKRGRGYVITADAVERWAAVESSTPGRPSTRRARRGAVEKSTGPMRRALT